MSELLIGERVQRTSPVVTVIGSLRRKARHSVAHVIVQQCALVVGIVDQSGMRRLLGTENELVVEFTSPLDGVASFWGALAIAFAEYSDW